METKIQIRKNPNGDTRTAPKDITFEQFQEANDSHKDDVRKVMRRFGVKLETRGVFHDHTKKSHEKLFYDNSLAEVNEGIDFVSNEWYQLHIAQERHHLLSRCPEDVDLVDVLEMLVDCVCAGKARAGEVRPIEIDDEILRKALANTVIKIDEMTEVVE